MFLDQINLWKLIKQSKQLTVLKTCLDEVLPSPEKGIAGQHLHSCPNIYRKVLIVCHVARIIDLKRYL